MKGGKYYVTGRKEMLGILVGSFWKYFRKIARVGHRGIGTMMMIM
jgi:hypothetical protein